MNHNPSQPHEADQQAIASSNAEPTPAPGSGGPMDGLTDGRQDGDWRSRWDGEALRRIRCEFAYVALIYGLSTAGIFLVWNGNVASWFHIQSEPTFQSYAITWLAGALGGVTFSAKWLYHSVARLRWNADRWIWRVATPFISAALSVALAALIRSNFVQIVASHPLTHPSGALAFGFLAGYFSDNVIGAMLRYAERVFGTVRSRSSVEAKSGTSTTDQAT